MTQWGHNMWGSYFDVGASAVLAHFEAANNTGLLLGLKFILNKFTF